MALAAPPRLSWESRTRQLEPSPSRLDPPSAASDARLVVGDNLTGLTCLADDPTVHGQVALAYLDPPFLTGREHFFTQKKSKDASREASPSARSKTAAFDDRWSTLNEYLDALEPRVRAARALLAPHGSLVLHVDPKTSHYAKILCDELFGPECFASEIIWRYRRWPAKTANFQRVHDVLLRYVKDADVKPRFHQLYEPLAPSTLATWGNAKQRAVTNTSGQRLRSSKTEEKTPGTPLGDVWDISIVAPVARERTGYPTQKPELLLGRLVESLTDPGDLVLDPYAGSGTTLVAALRRGRRALGVDQGEAALGVMRTRLGEAGFTLEEQKVVPRLRRATSPKTARAESASSEPAPRSEPRASRARVARTA